MGTIPKSSLNQTTNTKPLDKTPVYWYNPPRPTGTKENTNATDTLISTHLSSLLSLRREHDSSGEQLACQYLQDHGFQPVTIGGTTAAYIAGDPNSPLAFMAHIDTVHYGSDETHQDVVLNNGIWTLAESSRHSGNCLGADDAAGVAIILELLNRRAINARFIIHRGEECGTIGARAIQGHESVAGINWAISLDRKGTGEVVRTQRSRATASHQFTEWVAERLATEMGSPWRVVDGAFTDSAEYAQAVQECTNLSVGYFDQHSADESLNEDFVERLLVALPNVNWEHAPVERNLIGLS